ncbi:MAG: hypothetical protein IH795_04520 [Bacteroidetes bacterium]|nr:hypothetical protein [Bacteroidota bacterium]
MKRTMLLLSAIILMSACQTKNSDKQINNQNEEEMEMREKMTDLQNLIDRNQKFASEYEGNLSIMPQFLTIVLACVDARVDPAHVLGLELGEALVFRNAGARVTRDVELDLGILWTLGSRIAG